MMSFPVQRDVVCDPSQDGYSHLNVWSRAQTKLGRALSNMANIGVSIPKDGFFITLEGYWWYLATGRLYPQFANLNGFEARRYGKTLKKVHMDDFEERIKNALTIKIRSNRWILDELTKPENALPLCHYYVYGKHPECVVRLANNSLWQLDHIESIRSNGGVKS